MEKTIKRINELAAAAKERELTAEELEEREGLRRKYIDSVKGSLAANLERVRFVEKDGTITKPQKKVSGSGRK